jgi:hypothetical protein
MIGEMIVRTYRDLLAKPGRRNEAH